MKYPLLLGIIIGVTDIIPYFGPILGAIPTLMIAATVSTNLLIKAGIALAILQFVESNILSPYIVGKSLRMHPVVIMLALLVGGDRGNRGAFTISSYFSGSSYNCRSYKAALETLTNGNGFATIFAYSIN